jgi:hypothetical protein
MLPQGTEKVKLCGQKLLEALGISLALLEVSSS